MSETLWDVVTTLIFGFPVDEQMLDPQYPHFLQRGGGLCLTLIITVVSLSIGSVCAIALNSLSSLRDTITSQRTWFRALLCTIELLINSLLSVVRAVPVMLLVLLVYYAPYPLFQLRIPPIFLAVGALSLYSAVYLYPLLKRKPSTMDSALIESSKLLGFSWWQRFFYLFLPLRLRVMVPAILGVGITVFKDTSVLMVVGIAELTFTSRQLFVANPLHYSVIMLAVVLLYWGVATSASIAVGYLDTKYSVGLNSKSGGGVC